jgi:hypothetical protein
VQETATQYWAPVATATVSMMQTHYVVSQPCGACAVTQAVPVGRSAAVSVASYGPVVAPCQTVVSSRCAVTSACGSVPPATVETVACSPQVKVGGCSGPDIPCDPARCAWIGAACADPCASSTRPRFGINRNLPVCVDECAFVQLHSTVPYPYCSTMCFRWAASRGGFVDPTASDPVYYAPTVRLSRGEDVVITLSVTERSGVEYSDHVVLHVRDTP